MNETPTRPEDLTLSIIHTLATDYLKTVPTSRWKLFYSSCCTDNKYERDINLASLLKDWQPTQFTPQIGWYFLAQTLTNSYDYYSTPLGNKLFSWFEIAFMVNYPVGKHSDYVYCYLKEEINKYFSCGNHINQNSSSIASSDLYFKR